MNNIEFTDGWPSPILIGEIENKSLVDSVTDYILKNYDFQNLSIELNGGDLFVDKNFKEFRKKIVEPSFETYFKKITTKSLDEVDKKKFKAWLTGPGYGYQMINHNHKGAHLSAVFYLFNSDPNKGGEIVFHDPRGNANRGYTGDYWKDFFSPLKLKVFSYKFVVFPSFLYHQITTYTGNLRVGIAVDLFF